MRVTKRLEFDYGHRVLGHEGKCRHLHGHRGATEITVEAPRQDELDMVIDFGVIKQFVGRWLDDNWDHNMLLNADDPQLLHFQDTESRKPFVMTYGNPTAENMAATLFGVCQSIFSGMKGLKVVAVRIYETPTCWADCYE